MIAQAGFTDWDTFRETESRQRELLVEVWTVLRGVVSGVPVNTDYANELSEALDKEFNLT